MYLGGAQIFSNTPVNVPASTPTVLNATGTFFDDLSLWSAAAPSQIVIPAGVGHIVLWGHAHFQEQTAIGATTGVGRVRFLLNGNPPTASGATGFEIPIVPNVTSPSNTSAGAVFSTQLIAATPGDVWTVSCDQTTGQAMNMGAWSWGIQLYD